MFCQQSVISDAVAGLSISKVPVGNNLSGPNPSLPKIDGSIALDFSSQQLYYVGGNTWKTFTGFALSLSPVGAIPNANAATITGAVLNLQPASAAFPGVVTTGAQSFNGTKTFSAIIAPGTNYAAVAPIVATDNNSLTINNVTNQIAAEIADATHNGIVTTATQAFGGIKQFEDGVQMLNITSPGYSVLINTPTYFEQDSRLEGTLNSINLTGDAGVTVYDFPWHLQKCGRIVFMGLGSSGPVVLSAPGAFLTCPAGTIPATYRPLSILQRRAPCIMVTNGANTPAYVEIFPDGSMIFAIDAAMTTGFTAVAGTSDTTITYTI